ncbi:DUF3837 family protein [Lacrimispora algidixylanolytica]|uniref:DUF3837 domain-containing protein n=1 Tax=Lacrimispora algidixylanolytica TaxID=94868 RepID=A0A419T0Q3_9FIRM|nr:DUF3837 family protein [Lacrimispora algidixylanolytica]RKD31009.1 hypothetical protein BET01_03905 [Lacrimispora algidixylanolytica]
MIFYINKQAVEIKTRFENAPLTSPNEACAAMGMLYKIYGLSIPGKREMVSQMKEDFHGAVKNLPVPSEFAAKIITLLDDYYKDDPVTDEIYELLKYSYEEQK